MLNVHSAIPHLAKNFVGVEAISCAVVWDKPNENGEVLPNPRRDYRYNVDLLIDLLLRNVQIQAV